MTTVLIAPDSFKGSLTSVQVATAIADGWHRARPDDEILRCPLADGRTWSEALADRLAALAGPYAGERGYSAIGAVVGATQPHTMQSLRTRLPRSIFLLPGYGTQGATAEMTRAAFDENGLGAIVSASRSVLYPKSEPGGDWKSAIARAAAEMKQELQRTLKTPG